MKTKPKIGQIVYSLNVGNAARNREKKLTPLVVMKVGRKYFTAGHIVFLIDGWHENTIYSSTHKLFASEQEYLDTKETKEICVEFSNMFRYGNNVEGISIEALRTIKGILNAN